MSSPRRFQPGEEVEVRCLQEIQATLDGRGSLEGLPFMPEMATFCGQRFTVRHRLEKTCVEGFGARLLPDTVTLAGAYCDGAAHDGCQRRCPLLWKEAWLRRPGALMRNEEKLPAGGGAGGRWLTKRDDGRYLCQSTELGRATHYLFPLSFKRCSAEWRCGNVNLTTAIRYLWTPFLVKVKTKLLGLRSVQPVGAARKTPDESLGLQPGERVRVKSPEEIAVTLDPRGRNRGLAFTPQMLPFCGREYRVIGRVEKAIMETTGEMRRLKNTVILEGVTCDGHTILGGCSRHVYHLWREIWLQRVQKTP